LKHPHPRATSNFLSLSTCSSAETAQHQILDAIANKKSLKRDLHHGHMIATFRPLIDPCGFDTKYLSRRIYQETIPL